MSRHTRKLVVTCMAGIFIFLSAVTATADVTKPGAPPALGLAVQPGGLLIQDVAPGALYDLKQKTGIALTIYNRDDKEHTYTVSAHRPSEVGNRRVPLGYADIIDPSWLWFEHGEVRVPARGDASVRIYLKIPGGSQYRNQHWSVSVGVVGKPEPGDMLTLAVYPRFEIETASAARPDEGCRVAGAMGLCPSVVRFTGLQPGTRRRAAFTLFNADSTEHAYRFSAVSPGEIGEGRRIYPSGGYSAKPGESWVRTRWPEVTLCARGSLQVPVQVRVPAGASLPADDWEEILLVQRDDGQTGFVRVRVKKG